MAKLILLGEVTAILELIPFYFRTFTDESWVKPAAAATQEVEARHTEGDTIVVDRIVRSATRDSYKYYN